MEQIPDANLFMMCEKLNTTALTKLPAGYNIRQCRRNELDIWKEMHFDDPELARQYNGYMTGYFNNVYSENEDIFFRDCLFVCDNADRPIGTCFAWKSYGAITTIHWYKVHKSFEGRGIGRALLSTVMKAVPPSGYPVYLHTQPASYRAIKLYSDFGFALLTDPVIGYRNNDLASCMPILKEHMTEEAYAGLRFAKAPEAFLNAVLTSKINQF